MEKIEWTVTGADGVAKSTRPPMKNVALQVDDEKMNKGQREGVKIWNEMVTRLIELGGMEAK